MELRSLAPLLEELVEVVVHRVSSHDLVRDVSTQHHVFLVLQDGGDKSRPQVQPGRGGGRKGTEVCSFSLSGFLSKQSNGDRHVYIYVKKTIHHFMPFQVNWTGIFIDEVMKTAA